MDPHDIPTSYAAALQDYLDLIFAHKLERERRRRRLLAAQRYQEECIKLSIPSTSPSFIGVAGYLTSYVERVGSTASVSNALSDLRCYFRLERRTWLDEADRHRLKRFIDLMKLGHRSTFNCRSFKSV